MKSVKILLVAIAALGITLSASAVALTVGDAFYVGSIEDGNPPGGGTPSNEFNWVTQLITLAPGSLNVATTNPAGELLDRSSNTLLYPNMPTPTGEAKDETPDGMTAAANSLYFLGKYGNDQTSGQISHVWYVGSFAVGTELTLPTAGLSHETVFTGVRPTTIPPPGVPDGGLSVVLLGIAMLGLGAARRFVRL